MEYLHISHHFHLMHSSVFCVAHCLLGFVVIEIYIYIYIGREPCWSSATDFLYLHNCSIFVVWLLRGWHAAIGSLDRCVVLHISAFFIATSNLVDNENYPGVPPSFDYRLMVFSMWNKNLVHRSLFGPNGCHLCGCSGLGPWLHCHHLCWRLCQSCDLFFFWAVATKQHLIPLPK